MTEHRHDWQPSERDGDPHPWRCAECNETSAMCSVCEGASGGALLICPRCERREERVLEAIGRILDQAWGAAGGSGQRFRLFTVKGTGVDEDDRIRQGTEDRLQGWVARWSEHTQNPGMGAIDYLRSRLIWAVHNPKASAWDEYRSDIRSIRGSALVEVGLAPEELADRCMHCRGRLVQDRADWRGKAHDDGLQDEVRCTGCGLTWTTRDQARISVRHHILALRWKSPSALVTLEQARKIFTEVPIETMRSWVKRDRKDHVRSIAETDAWDDRWTAWEDSGQIGPLPAPPTFYDRQLPERGRRGSRSLYRLGDLDSYATRRLDDERPGRRAG